MDGVILLMIGVSIVLAAVAVGGVLWGVKNRQFDDYTRFLDGTKFDSEDALREAYELEQRRKKMQENSGANSSENFGKNSGAAGGKSSENSGAARGKSAE